MNRPLWFDTLRVVWPSAVVAFIVTLWIGDRGLHPLVKILIITAAAFAVFPAIFAYVFLVESIKEWLVRRKGETP